MGISGGNYQQFDYFCAKMSKCLPILAVFMLWHRDCPALFTAKITKQC